MITIDTSLTPPDSMQLCNFEEFRSYPWNDGAESKKTALRYLSQEALNIGGVITSTAKNIEQEIIDLRLSIVALAEPLIKKCQEKLVKQKEADLRRVSEYEKAMQLAKDKDLFPSETVIDSAVKEELHRPGTLRRGLSRNCTPFTVPTYVDR